MKKKIGIIVVVIIIAVASVVATFISHDLQEEEVFKSEVNEILDQIDDVAHLDVEALDQKLNEIKLSGDYAKIEKAFKTYIYDYVHDFDLVKTYKEINDEKILSILSINNYKEDGKSFTKTKSYLKEKLEFLEQSKEKYATYMSEEKIMSYIDNLNLKKSFVNLYRTNTIDNIADDSVNGFSKSLTRIMAILTYSGEVIDLLKDNPDAWNVEGGKIVFSSESVMNNYNELLNKLKNLHIENS
jgi:hypothetical protein